MNAVCKIAFHLWDNVFIYASIVMVLIQFFRIDVNTLNAFEKHVSLTVFLIFMWSAVREIKKEELSQ